MVAMGRGAAASSALRQVGQPEEGPAVAGPRSMGARSMTMMFKKPKAGRRGAFARLQRRLSKFSDRMKQDEVRRLYKNHIVQVSVATMIGGNFLTNCIEKQMDPWSELYPDTWNTIEFVWNMIFIIELLWNMYGSFYLTQWRGHFLSSGVRAPTKSNQQEPL
jgi:hypothetical protein